IENLRRVGVVIRHEPAAPGAPASQTAGPLATAAPLSRADLPRLDGAIRTLYRVTERATADRSWMAAAAAETGWPLDQPPETLAHAAVIDAAGRWVLCRMMPGGVHTNRDCADITESDLDLRHKAQLLELRDHLCRPFFGHVLATDPPANLRFRRFLEGVLGDLAPAGAAVPPAEAGCTPLPAAPAAAAGPPDRPSPAPFCPALAECLGAAVELVAIAPPAPAAEHNRAAAEEERLRVAERRARDLGGRLGELKAHPETRAWAHLPPYQFAERVAGIVASAPRGPWRERWAAARGQLAGVPLPDAATRDDWFRQITARGEWMDPL